MIQMRTTLTHDEAEQLARHVPFTASVENGRIRPMFSCQGQLAQAEVVLATMRHRRTPGDPECLPEPRPRAARSTGPLHA